MYRFTLYKIQVTPTINILKNIRYYSTNTTTVISDSKNIIKPENSNTDTLKTKYPFTIEEKYRKRYNKDITNDGTVMTQYNNIYLPNDTFILLPPNKKHVSNTALFSVPLYMNKVQIRNYLEQIYKVRIRRIGTLILTGKIRRNKLGFYVKRPDQKRAYVKFYEDFTFPPLPSPSQIKDKV